MSSLKKWLRADEEDQQAWAVSYLEKKGIRLYSRPGKDYEYLLEIEKFFQKNPHYKLAENSMKAAWRQQKLRGKRKGKTEFSLVISKEKKSKLKALSSKKGKSMNETLEELIDDESARQIEHQKKLMEAKKELNQRLEMTRGAQAVKLNEVEATTDALLYLLDEYIKKMVQCEIDAFKANHASIHDHIGTKDYKESRLSAENEAINQALSKIPAWKKRTFPLDISTKINIKSMLKS